ncbi:MAG: hypothetical protein JSV30_00720 [Candidatus Omnitrophota bacterium]|nr:MAG: hypothetical protein JSV30_00720 [Candidatus Omnitrophota bacterium]
MSWRLFWQIVLLIVVAAVIMSISKFGVFRCKYMGKGMYPHKEMYEEMHKGRR